MQYCGPRNSVLYLKSDLLENFSGVIIGYSYDFDHVDHLSLAGIKKFPAQPRRPSFQGKLQIYTEETGRKYD